MKNILTKLVAPAMLGLFATTATAMPIATDVWTVSSTGNINCGTNPHGLWTNQYRPGTGSCLQYFDFDSTQSTLTQYDDGTAHLDAIAVNDGNIVATIDIWFEGFTDTYAHNKTGGGPVAADWDYYTSIRGGSSIVIDGNTFLVDVHDRGSNNGTTGGSDDFVFQIGTGANDKTSVFGGSSWLDVFGIVDNSPVTYAGGAHWDLNMDFTARVSEPSILMLMSGGLMIAGFATRRRA